MIYFKEVEGRGTKCLGNLPLGNKDVTHACIVFSKHNNQNYTVQTEATNACNKTTHASTKLHTPSQVKKRLFNIHKKNITLSTAFQTHLL